MYTSLVWSVGGSSSVFIPPWLIGSSALCITVYTALEHFGELYCSIVSGESCDLGKLGVSPSTGKHRP